MISRRQFLKSVGAVSGALAIPASPRFRAAATDDISSIAPFGEVTVFKGDPRQRGLAYGTRFAGEIREFFEREIYTSLIANPAAREDALRYAGACGKVIRSECPIIADEIEGMAEGTGLRVEEHLLLTLHEELYHRGILPSIPHCTAVAVGKPRTKEATFVGQTWDWMPRVAGKSRMLEWKRPEGPSLLAYGYPGLWVGAGMNSHGLALCWTSAALGRQNQSPRVGLPSYVMLTHLLHQENLNAAQEFAKRNVHAGWFTFVMGDATGRLLNIEGSPEGIATEEAKGSMVRVSYGIETMVPKTPVKFDETCLLRRRRLEKWLDRAGAECTLATLQDSFADSKEGVCGGTTIDMMVFDTTNRIAHASRGPRFPAIAWKEYRFS